MCQNQPKIQVYPNAQLNVSFWSTWILAWAFLFFSIHQTSIYLLAKTFEKGTFSSKLCETVCYTLTVTGSLKELSLKSSNLLFIVKSVKAKMIDSPVNADIYLLNSSGRKQWTCDMVEE